MADVKTAFRSPSTDQSDDPVIKVHLKSFLVVAAVDFIYFAQLNGVVGSGFLAQTIGQLFGDSSKNVWFSTVINILTLALIPPIAQGADYWGRKWFLVIPTALGFVGSIVVSRSQNINSVIAGFTVLGIGYGSQSLLFAVISEVMPRKHRPYAQASANIFGGSGAIVGVYAGGALIRNGNLENYRIYFYINAAFFAMAGIICALLYNPPPRELQKSLTKSAKLRKLDWISYFLLSPGLTLFCVGLAWAKAPYQWNNAHVLAPLTTGFVMVIMFLFYGWRIKTDGLLHHSLFQHRNFPIALVVIFAEGFGFFSCNNYFAFEVSLFKHTDSLTTGAHFSIVFWTSMIAAFAVGAWSAKRRVVRTPLLVGFISLLLFNILMATAGPNTPARSFWGYPVLAGTGIGAIIPIMLVAAQLSTPVEQIATVSGLMIAIRSVGALLSLAINNTIFNEALSSNIPKKVAAATLPLGLPESSLGMLIGALTSQDDDALQHIPGATPQIIQAGAAGLMDAYKIAFRNIWICASVAIFLALVTCIFFVDPSSEFNNHIDAPAEIEILSSATYIHENAKRGGVEAQIEEEKQTSIHEERAES